MRVRYTAQAAAELEDILSYLQERNPAAAAAVATHIEGQVGRIGQFPLRGRPKYRPGVRMLIVRPYPFWFSTQLNATKCTS